VSIPLGSPSCIFDLNPSAMHSRPLCIPATADGFVGGGVRQAGPSTSHHFPSASLALRPRPTTIRSKRIFEGAQTGRRVRLSLPATSIPQ